MGLSGIPNCIIDVTELGLSPFSFVAIGVSLTRKAWTDADDDGVEGAPLIAFEPKGEVTITAIIEGQIALNC